MTHEEINRATIPTPDHPIPIATQQDGRIRMISESEYNKQKKTQVLAAITPICNAFKIDFEYEFTERGESLYSKDSEAINSRMQMLKDLIRTIVTENWFDVISFDNLALKQLDIKSMVKPEVWKEIYMGDDGLDGKMTSCSMFVDMVEKQFAKNSCATERYPLMDTIEEMYSFLKTQ